MLGDEMARARVQRASEERRKDHVVQGVRRSQANEKVVEERLRADIDEVDACEWDFENEDRPHSIEQDLKGAEERLAEDRIEEEGLEGCGEVGIQAINTERLVVREVVWLLALLSSESITSTYQFFKNIP